MGANVARHMAKRGFDTLLVEEHGRVGVPVQCAGLFSPGIFDHVDFPLGEVRLNEIRGAHVRSPSGMTLTLDAGRPMAYAINRGGFDQACVRRAEAAGAQVWTHARALTFAQGEGGVDVRVRRGHSAMVEHVDVHARLVVGADGAASTVGQAFGFPRAREVVSCYGAQMRSLNELTLDKVEMFVGNSVAPGFFGWIVPQGQGHGMVELGVHMTPRPARLYFQEMLQNKVVEPFVRGAESLYEIAAVIPFGPKARTTTDHVMLVGDAAAQAKPTSGGGVYTGLKCSEMLVEVASDALEKGDTGDAALKPYHEAWSSTVGRELRIGARLRKAFMHLRDDEIEHLFGELQDPEAMHLINTLGDIDRPSRLAATILRKKPQLLRYTARAVATSIFT